MNWLKENWDGIKILLVFFIIIVLGLTGAFDYILNFIVSIFSGFSTSDSENYIPGENFPFQ